VQARFVSRDDRSHAAGAEQGDQLGAGRLLSEASVLAALALVRQGRVFDLDPGRFPGMARHEAQPPFDLITYRTPRGERNQGDLPFLAPEVNRDNFGFILETVIGSTHNGTHIDALCHVTAGADSHWYGGFEEARWLGDKGALASDASKLPPILARGVLLDAAGYTGVDALAAAEPVHGDTLEAVARGQGVEVRRGDVVLIRTGQIRDWPQAVNPPGSEAGVSLDGARWLSAREPLAVGADNSAFEVLPSGIDGSPQPVHVHLMVERGIYIIEWVDLEELAREGVREFLFICLPLRIRGATGSMVRPVAIV
jgi:kynurenine formamidase